MENTRRSFFKKAAAALGVVAAAGATTNWISKSVAASGDANAKYAADMDAQDRAIAGNPLVPMTDGEKQQRLDDLLDCHYREIA